MKKRTLTLLAALVLMAGAASVFAEDATVVVTGDALFVTPLNVTFSGVTLTGFDQTTTSTSNAWTAEDATGTGAGWHLTIGSGDFLIQADDDVQEIYTDGVDGTFTVTYDGVGPSAAINEDDDAATVRAVIEGLANVTTVGVSGTGVEADPWVIVFLVDTGSGIMTTADTTLVSTIRFATIDISETDQQFQIQLADGDIAVVDGNTKPTSSVASLTNIGDSTLTFLSALEGQGMGSYTLDPDFQLDVIAEVYAGTYVATFTVASVSGP